MDPKSVSDLKYEGRPLRNHKAVDVIGRDLSWRSSDELLAIPGSEVCTIDMGELHL